MVKKLALSFVLLIVLLTLCASCSSENSKNSPTINFLDDYSYKHGGPGGGWFFQNFTMKFHNGITVITPATMGNPTIITGPTSQRSDKDAMKDKKTFENLGFNGNDVCKNTKAHGDGFEVAGRYHDVDTYVFFLTCTYGQETPQAKYSTAVAFTPDNGITKYSRKLLGGQGAQPLTTNQINCTFDQAKYQREIALDETWKNMSREKLEWNERDVQYDCNPGKYAPPPATTP